jgi:hypothetical protein
LARMPTCPVLHVAARKVEWCTEGQSLSPLLHATHQLDRTTTTWTDAAYSQFPRPEHPERFIDLDCLNKSQVRDTPYTDTLEACCILLYTTCRYAIHHTH